MSAAQQYGEIADGLLGALAESLKVCGATSSRGESSCDRPRGHDGAHIEYRDNGTFAWGLG